MRPHTDLLRHRVVKLTIGPAYAPREFVAAIRYQYVVPLRSPVRYCRTVFSYVSPSICTVAVRDPSAVLVPYSTHVVVARRCEWTCAPIVTDVAVRDSTHDVDEVGGPGVENVCVALAVPADVVALARHV